MKSKKKEKSSYNSKELSIEPTPKAIQMVKDSIPADAEFIITPTPRKMIIRKEVQKEIDIDKRIKYLIGTGHYNLQQIAGMWSSVSLERVKEIHTKMKQDV